MVKILGFKPSTIRKDVLAIAASTSAVAGIVVSLATNVPTIGAVVGIAGSVVTVVNLVAKILTTPAVADGIDELDTL